MAFDQRGDGNQTAAIAADQVTTQRVLRLSVWLLGCRGISHVVVLVVS
jgi:hypothetical protein